MEVQATTMARSEVNTTMARSEVDTTRPFKSVKEAVAVFGDRILSTNSTFFKTNTIPSSSSFKTNANHKLDATPEPITPAPQTQNMSSCNTDTISKLDAPSKPISLPSPPPPFCSSPINKPMYSAPSSPPSYTSSVSNREKENENENETETENIVFNYLRRLELEVAETKRELMALKRRESEMEIGLASLNTQLNRNLAKLAEIEASKEEEISVVMEEKPSKVRSNHWEETVENSVQYEYLPSLAHALSLKDFGDEFGLTRKRKVQKMKPIVPLVGDIFSRRKSSKENNSFYSESFHSVLV
ncbi:WEB family protein [Rhynchospora pubera]|uniref:WEB family protein n=1 Tax=Rhynchospora pubera TaxID=906938 RepID=A0AAV8D464_9POAL|nr:WEB family protein [Rhynchospora pubera]